MNETNSLANLYPHIASRTQGGNNCPDCGNRRLHPGNNLAAVNPEIVKEWHPTKNVKGPQAYFANSHFKVGGYAKSAVTNGMQKYTIEMVIVVDVRIVMRTILNISNVKIPSLA